MPSQPSPPYVSIGITDQRDTATCLPELPLGCSDQGVDSFRDSHPQRLLYEFRHVYRPRQRILDRQQVWLDELDEELSYWLVTRAAPTAAGDERPVGRWLTYGQARSRLGAQLSFAQFSQLHDKLTALLPA